MQTFHSTEFRPRTYECDVKARLRPHELMKHFQEIASSHGEKMGLGMKWMLMNGYIWVLVDMKIGIEKMPRWNEHMTGQSHI